MLFPREREGKRNVAPGRNFGGLGMSTEPKMHGPVKLGQEDYESGRGKEYPCFQGMTSS